LICPVDGKLYEIPPAGRAWFEDLGLDLDTLRSKRGTARQCLDWTERRHHLAGPLGVTLLSRMVALGWIETVAGSRAARLTTLGREELREAAGGGSGGDRGTGGGLSALSSRKPRRGCPGPRGLG
jgi:hypothetical protein